MILCGRLISNNRPTTGSHRQTLFRKACANVPEDRIERILASLETSPSNVTLEWTRGDSSCSKFNSAMRMPWVDTNHHRCRSQPMPRAILMCQNDLLFRDPEMEILHGMDCGCDRAKRAQRLRIRMLGGREDGSCPPINVSVVNTWSEPGVLGCGNQIWRMILVKRLEIIVSRIWGWQESSATSKGDSERPRGQQKGAGQKGSIYERFVERESERDGQNYEDPYTLLLK